MSTQMRIDWLRGLAAKGDKGVVDNIDARSLGRVAEELEYLHYFFQEADFGPAHEDVVYIINEKYVAEHDQLPEGYDPDAEE